MANCNCNDFPISCAPHAPGGDCCHPHGCPPHPHPCPPPPFKGGTSMYIGARYVPIFADPVEWDDEREYEPLTIVIHDGSCYTSKCYVPKGAQLPPYPEGQTKYWVKTSDYNYQFADLKKTVLDLSRLVEQFQKDNKAFTDLINGWNEKVQQWENDMTAWGERLDTVESNITDLTASLNAEIDRAKAAEQANAAAITKETTDRQHAISELEAAYKAADTAEAQTRAEADSALSNRITTNKTDIDAIKAEQVIQNTNISTNAKNISDNAAEIAKHAARLTGLESNASDWDDAFPDTTIAQEVQKEELARANADTALNGRCDTIAADVEEVRDLANHKVDTTTYTEGQAAQDARITELENDKVDNTVLSDYVTKTVFNADQKRQDNIVGDWNTEHPDENISSVMTAVKNVAWQSYKDIGTWSTSHPEQSIAECVTSLENETAANAAKTDANAAVIGDWNAEHPGKTIAQAVSDNTTALDNVVTYGTNGAFTTVSATKAAYTPAPLDEINIQTARLLVGDANNEFMTLPAKSFPTRVAFDAFKKDTNDRLDAISGDIPDVSGFVTNDTYNAGQAAQDTKITAAQAAADKANASIGDWDAEHPGKTISQCATDLDARTRTNSQYIGDWHTEHPTHTISQEITDIHTDLEGLDYLALLDKIYPEGNIIYGHRLDETTLFPHRYEANTSFAYIEIPVTVPYIVSSFQSLWTANIQPPRTLIMYDAAGIAYSKPITSFEIKALDGTTFFAIRVESSFAISSTGFYYYRLHSTDTISYSWTKNATPFSSLA